MEKFDQKKYIQKYVKENYKRIEIRLNRKTDNDIIEKLERVENKNEYIKKIIRDDLKN